MYYCTSENILARWDGAKWVQINKQKTLAELGGVAQSVYEAKMALLEKADTDNATAISNLTTYVGTLPEGATASNIVAYIDAKTSGIASDAALAELAGRVATAEGKISTIETAIAEGGSVDTAIKAAKKAGDDAQAEVDALELVVSEYKTSNDAALAGVKTTAEKGVADAATAQARADEAYNLANGKATMGEVNTAIANAGHAVKADVDAAIEQLGKDYVAADSALKSELEGKINAKVDQTAYDTKVAALEGEDSRLAGLISGIDEAYKAADTELGNRIGTLEGQITGLSGAMHFKGVETTLPEGEALASYADGDVIIVGEKEYVFNDGSFVLFGDVSAEGERIAALETTVGDDESGLVKAVADNAAAIAAEKERAEAKEAELVAADATNLQAAKDYADDAVEALGIGDYIKKADADVAYAAVGHNHDDKYDAKGDAAQALVDAKAYADGLKSTIDAAYAAADTALSNRIKDLEDNKAGYATTTQVATAKDEAIAAAAIDAANKDAVVLAEAQKASTAVQTALDTYKSENNAAVALKANAADVYAKSETYTQAQVDAAIEAAVTAAHTGGSF